jgi:hypothetical protein
MSMRIYARSKAFFLLVGILFIDLHISYAQTKIDTAKGQTDSTAQAAADHTATEAELFSPSLEFSSLQKNQDQLVLSAVLRAKINGVLYKLPQLKVSFSQVVGEEVQLLGSAITDRNGKAQYLVPIEKLAPIATAGLTFQAQYAGNKQLEAVEEVLTIHRASLELTPIVEDSSFQVQVKLADLSTGEAQPVKEAAIGLYVERSFMPLKIGEGTTDETGEAIIDVMPGLPGDEKGGLTLFARVEENEVLGGVESSFIQKWGVPAADAKKKQGRTLWTATPPLWMLVTFIVLLTVVWGHYIVIMVQLIRLRKEEPGYHDHHPA